MRAARYPASEYRPAGDCQGVPAHEVTAENEENDHRLTPQASQREQHVVDGAVRGGIQIAPLYEEAATDVREKNGQRCQSPQPVQVQIVMLGRGRSTCGWGHGAHALALSLARESGRVGTLFKYPYRKLTVVSYKLTFLNHPLALEPQVPSLDLLDDLCAVIGRHRIGIVVGDGECCGPRAALGQGCNE